MSDYASLKKRKAPQTVTILLALLVILELCSLAVLMSRVMSYSPAETKHVISLTKGSGVRTGRRGADGIIQWNTEGAAPRRFLSAAIMPGAVRSGRLASSEEARLTAAPGVTAPTPPA